VLQLITSAQGAMNGLMVEVLEGHIRCHVLGPKDKPNSERAQAAEELLAVLRSCLK
jgi:DNA-binding FrmR family transcriptional regulator